MGVRGTFSVRLTVSDGQDSATGQTTVNIRTLTGRWVLIPPLANGSDNLTLTQNGNGITGTVSRVSTAPGTVPSECPLTGEVRAASPRIFMRQPDCPLGGGVVWPVVTFLLDPSSDANTIQGVIEQVTGPLVPVAWSRQ
jgi:hypothetical protein